MSGREEKQSRAGYNEPQQQRSRSFQEDIRPRSDESRQPRTGRIVKFVQRVSPSGRERFEVEIRFDGMESDIQQATYKRAFILSHTLEELAMLFGDPETIINKKVMVQSAGTREDQGIATIISHTGDGNLEKANTLKPFGTVLASAGSAII